MVYGKSPCFFTFLEVFFSLQIPRHTSCIVGSHLNELTKKNIFHYYAFFFLIWLIRKVQKLACWYCITESGVISNQRTQKIISWLVYMTRFYALKKCQRVAFHVRSFNYALQQSLKWTSLLHTRVCNWRLGASWTMTIKE